MPGTKRAPVSFVQKFLNGNSECGIDRVVQTAE
jgi:hypothetical protein